MVGQTCINVTVQRAGGVPESKLIPTVSGSDVSLRDVLNHPSVRMVPNSGSGLSIYVDNGRGPKLVPQTQWDSFRVGNGYIVSQAGKPEGGY